MPEPAPWNRLRGQGASSCSLAAGCTERYVAGVRRLVATFALVGLIASPVVARTRLFCKYTGVEITSDCWERETPVSALVTAQACCDHRVESPLPPSKLSGQSFEVLAPVLGASVAASLPAAEPFSVSFWRVPAVRTGPPLFVRLRALLI
jgi:hypothetical protein